MSPPPSLLKIRRADALFYGALIGSLALMTFPFLLSRVSSRESRSGSLVAVNETVVWRSPAEGPFRMLAPDEARARFEVRNTGGRPVKVVATESSCGCATPTVQPTTIGPGDVATVSVASTPIQVGERQALITLHTDSPTTPRVKLILRIIGSRRPPFLTEAFGDVTFESETTFGEAREFTVRTLERKGEHPLPPAVTSHLSILRIGQPRLDSEAPYFPEPEAVTRSYLYVASLTPPYPSERFDGDITVTDPWDTDHVLTLRVHGEVRPGLRVVPTSVTISGEGASAEVLAIFRSKVTDLVLDAGDKDHPFEWAGPTPLGERGQFATYRIRLRPGAKASGRHELFVVDPSSGLRIPFSVLIKGRE